MKNCKTLYEDQTANCLQENIQASPKPPLSDKSLLSLWNKNVLSEIYRNTQTFVFKLLQECGS